jgi:hypothetical protein
VAVETTILTEQTEFTDRRQPPPTIAQQIFCAWISQQLGRPNQGAQRPPHCAGPLKIVAQGGQLGSPRLRAGLGLHVWAGREIFIGKVVVVAGVHVPIATTWPPAGIYWLGHQQAEY